MTGAHKGTLGARKPRLVGHGRPCRGVNFPTWLHTFLSCVSQTPGSGVSSCVGWPLTAPLSVQSNENMEIASALQSEQHVKKELAKKLGQLQEKLGELKETVTPAPKGRPRRQAPPARQGGGGQPEQVTPGSFRACD